MAGGDARNQGIIVSGGVFKAENVAVGERATIVAADLAELRALVARLPPAEAEAAGAGAAELAEAAKSPEKASPAVVEGALARIETAAKRGAGTAEAAEKIVGIAMRLATMIL
jgi:hypothetical protein